MPDVCQSTEHCVNLQVVRTSWLFCMLFFILILMHGDVLLGKVNCSILKTLVCRLEHVPVDCWLTKDDCWGRQRPMMHDLPDAASDQRYWDKGGHAETVVATCLPCCLCFWMHLVQTETKLCTVIFDCSCESSCNLLHFSRNRSLEWTGGDGFCLCSLMFLLLCCLCVDVGCQCRK